MQRIIGQDRALDILRAALRSQRVHHAWLFTGPFGVGKHTAAIEFARILLDANAQPTLTGEIEADPESESSRLIDTGSHPDLHLIHKELTQYSDNAQLRRKKLMNIPLDLLRERMLGGTTSDGKSHEAAAYRTAVRNHGKVFIIDEAELLDAHTQNALLKTLEEPPAATYIILVTNRPERLLPTIRSRCQHVRFGSLDGPSMQQWIDRAELNISGGERTWIEQFADGSPGRARLAKEYNLHRWHEALAPMLKELERGSFPAAMGETMAGLVDEFAAAWVKANKNASKDAANKDGARMLLSMFAAYARSRLATACAKGDDPERWLNLTDLVCQAERQLYANVNLKMLLENLIVQFAAGSAVAHAGTS